jgi:drug/metabolite transporter (DMT)-like permease
VIVLGEPLSIRAIAGGAVVMLGVWITSRSESGKPLPAGEVARSAGEGSSN